MFRLFSKLGPVVVGIRRSVFLKQSLSGMVTLDSAKVVVLVCALTAGNISLLIFIRFFFLFLHAKLCNCGDSGYFEGDNGAG